MDQQQDSHLGWWQKNLRVNGSSKGLVSCMGGSPDELSEELVMQEKLKKGWRMNCDISEAMEGLENEL